MPNISKVYPNYASFSFNVSEGFPARHICLTLHSWPRRVPVKTNLDHCVPPKSGRRYTTWIDPFVRSETGFCLWRVLELPCKPPTTPPPRQWGLVQTPMYQFWHGNWSWMTRENRDQAKWQLVPMMSQMSKTRNVLRSATAGIMKTWSTEK